MAWASSSSALAIFTPPNLSRQPQADPVAGPLLRGLSRFAQGSSKGRTLRGSSPAGSINTCLLPQNGEARGVRSGWPVGPGVAEVDLFSSARFRPVPESPHGQRQQYHGGGNREQEDEGAGPGVSHVDVLAPVQEDLGGGESDEGEHNRHSEGASGHRRSQGPARGTAPETNQRQRAEDHEGKAAEKEQEEADVGDRRFLVGRGVVGKNLIERQANGSDAQHQQDPEKWRPPPHITSVCHFVQDDANRSGRRSGALDAHDETAATDELGASATR